MYNNHYFLIIGFLLLWLLPLLALYIPQRLPPNFIDLFREFSNVAPSSKCFPDPPTSFTLPHQLKTKLQLLYGKHTASVSPSAHSTPTLKVRDCFRLPPLLFL